MAVDNLLQSFKMAGESKDKARKRAAAAEQAKQTALLGSEIGASQTGLTETGKFISSAMQKGLVDSPLEAIKMLQMTPEQFVTQFGLAGVTDPKAQALSNEMLQRLDFINFAKANGHYRAMRANGIGGGDNDNDKNKNIKLKPVKVDPNIIYSAVMKDVVEKYLPNLKGADPQKISMKNFWSNYKGDDGTQKGKEVYDFMASEFARRLKAADNVFDNPKAAVGLNNAVQKFLGMAYSQDPEVYGSYSTGEVGGKMGQKIYKYNQFDIMVPADAIVEAYLSGESKGIKRTVVEEEVPGFKIPFTDLEFGKSKKYKVDESGTGVTVPELTPSDSNEENPNDL